MLHAKNLDFSFSGLKTAVLTLVKNHTHPLTTEDKANIARAFVDAMVEVLVAKSLAALQQNNLQRLVVAGGVGANTQLRNMLNAAAKKKRFEVFYPELEFCTDNGAMIAFAGALRLQRSPRAASKDYRFNVKSRWPLDQID
jgi:N6-L-threonylcarbamoyladenine synthase